jgi:hypothetical protein
VVVRSLDKLEEILEKSVNPSSSKNIFENLLYTPRVVDKIGVNHG